MNSLLWQRGQPEALPSCLRPCFTSSSADHCAEPRCAISFFICHRGVRSAAALRPEGLPADSCACVSVLSSVWSAAATPR